MKDVNSNLENIIYHSKMTMTAKENPWGSVVKVFPLAINKFKNNEAISYIGVKNSEQIPSSLIKTLENTGRYALHTIDKAAYGGRAIDLKLINPITGKPMTGSSSGTAINVRTCINDIGIGTDGGGSVLAPAMSVNLYSFISPLLEEEHMEKYKRISTDNISFTPSLGFITRSYEDLLQAITIAMELPEADRGITGELLEEESLDKYGPREPLIAYLKDKLNKVPFIISSEGPVDINGPGDTIYGHFDEYTREQQKRSGKGLVRVVNMAGASAVTLPMDKLGCALVFICKSDPKVVANMLEAARLYVSGKDSLIEGYYGNLDQYLSETYTK